MDKIEINTNKPNINHVNFPLVSIQAADELERISKNLETDLKNVKELSKWMLSKSFTEDCKLNFSKAYWETYPDKDYKEVESNSKRYVLDTYQKLVSPEELEKDELKNLIKFCVNFSDYSQAHKEFIDSLKGPCFR